MDPSFAMGAPLVVDMGGNDQIRTLARLPDGRIVAGVWSTGGAGERWSLLFLRPDGVPDASVGGDGQWHYDPGSGDDRVHFVMVDSAGRLLVYGQVADASGSGITLARLLP